MKLLPNQCPIPSINVTDIEEIKPLIDDMIEICNTPLNKFPSALALAHCQVDHENPLRFFVTHTGQVYINPEIIDGYCTMTSKEGCYSFGDREETDVQRHNIIDVKFTKLTESGLRTVTRRFEGKKAHMFQHEIDHMDGISIYDK